MRDLCSRLFHFDVSHVERDAILKASPPFLMRNYKEMSRSQVCGRFCFVGIRCPGERKSNRPLDSIRTDVFFLEACWRSVRSRAVAADSVDQYPSIARSRW